MIADAVRDIHLAAVAARELAAHAELSAATLDRLLAVIDGNAKAIAAAFDDERTLRLIADGAIVDLPVLTLADVAAEAPARPTLTVIGGGRA